MQYIPLSESLIQFYINSGNYLAKVLFFFESKEFVHHFARILSKLYLKQGYSITKRNDFLVKFATFDNKFDDNGTEIQQ